MFMSESLPAFRRRWKSEIDFRLFCYKEHSQTGKGVQDRRRNERSGHAMGRALGMERAPWDVGMERAPWDIGAGAGMDRSG